MVFVVMSMVCGEANFLSIDFFWGGGYASTFVIYVQAVLRSQLVDRWCWLLPPGHARIYGLPGGQSK